MAQTIPVIPPGISNGVPRMRINDHKYVEVTAPGSGVGVSGIKVRKGVGAAIVVVDSWLPANGATGVDQMQPFTLNLHANVDSNEFTHFYDDGTDGEPWSTGTLDDVSSILDGIQLAIDAPFPDFSTYEDDVSLPDASQPEDWTYLGHNYHWYADAPNDWAYSNATGDHSHVRYDDGGQPDSGELLARFYFDSADLPDYHGFNLWTRGAGSALRGYQVVMQGSGAYTSMRRMYDDDSTYGGAGSITFGVPDTDTWYWLKIRFQKNGSSSKQWWAKRWKDGDTEPASYTYGGSDTWDAGSSGYVGLTNIKGYSRVSDFQIIPAPAVYVSSGEWTSPSIDTTPIELYSHGLVTWDETLPTDTTIGVFARWRNNGAWIACTNGAEVPGITTGEHTEAGASKDSLEFKVELDTTDTSETPIIENLQIYHEPLAPEALEVDVHGVSCTVANGSLNVWGIRQVIGGVNDEAWDDVTAQTDEPFNLKRAGDQMVIELSYGDFIIESITADLFGDLWMVASDRNGFKFSMDPIKYASVPFDARWNCQTPWAPMGHVYEWVVIDRSLGIHADAYFLVGHYQLDDQPASLVAGALNLSDHLSSLLAEGYARDDHLAQVLAQAWRRDDSVGFFLPSIETTSDQPGMFVVAVRQIDDQPTSVQVMGVNRDGKIEVTMVKDSLWAELTARGYTRG